MKPTTMTESNAQSDGMTTQSGVDVVEWLNRRAAAFRHMLGDRDSDTEDAMLAAIAEIIALRSQLERKELALSAYKTGTEQYHALNGHREYDAEKRADICMAQMIEGCLRDGVDPIGIRNYLKGHFDELLECVATERSRVAEAERVGVERAAKWHDERRRDLEAASHTGDYTVGADIRAHTAYAAAIRALSASTEPPK